MSLVGALTPLGKAAPKYWMRSAVAYTVAGCVSAASVGALLGLIGQWLAGATALYCVVPLALILAAREWGLIHFRLPECNRQTKKGWANEFGFAMASAMWGLHIGLGFATRITYGGFLVLVAMAIAVGQPAYGAVLLLMYWVGRTMPVWLVPELIWQGQAAEELPSAILASRDIYRRLVGLALLWSAGVATLISLHTRSAWIFKLIGGLR